jgi:hypothetical protein
MEPRPPSGPVKPARSPLGTVLGITAIVMVLVVTFALVPAMAMVVLAVFIVIALQYFLWGRWLGGLIRSEEARAAAEEELP